MKRIKFISNNNHQKEFSTTVRKKVNDYFKENDISPKGNIALFIQTSAMLTIYLLPFILILLIPMNGWIAMLLSAKYNMDRLCQILLRSIEHHRFS